MNHTNRAATAAAGPPGDDARQQTTAAGGAACKPDPTLTACYPRDADTVVARGSAVLQSERCADHRVQVPADLPCNVIVVHGVNDVGTSYQQVEQGLCQGLGERLGSTPFVPGSYRVPTRDDQGKLHDDPDAVFYRRTLPEGHRTPVIPFYWGFRAAKGSTRSAEQNFHGQHTDRHGNRLDKDYAKGGGPFANATTTLPDMWGPGAWGTWGVVEAASRDPLRPVLAAPGRMYMILAARRLAALVAMIRDRHADDVVNIVAHSQGCLLSLLAQAFLMEQGLRPADTLVLTHPPYSLVDDVSLLSDASDLLQGDADVKMKDRYAGLAGGQTLHARLQTLVNIVQGVAAKRHATPSLHALKEPAHRGMVGAKWKPDAPERDNRGKVYLYFSPEDMTVALDKVQGIGWQGVPDVQEGRRRSARGRHERVQRKPLAELGAAFFQRVFTLRKRPHPDTGEPVRVGQARPHDFVLRTGGETGYEHVHDKPPLRKELAHLPHDAAAPGGRPSDGQTQARRQRAVRRINGEPLPRPVEADLYAGAVPPQERPQALHGSPAGAWERIDPSDAATASTRLYSYRRKWQLVDDLPPDTLARLADHAADGFHAPQDSPHPPLHDGSVRATPYKRAALLERLNRDKPPSQRCPAILAVHTCLDGTRGGKPTGRLLVLRLETPDEYRLRTQHSLAQRSFHSAIFGSAANHRNVTAYDLAIGGGRASSHPAFYAYLCAVADWRLKKDLRGASETTPKWSLFKELHKQYFDCEPLWRKRLIESNADYYSNGSLPSDLPLLPDDLPRSIVCESLG